MNHNLPWWIVLCCICLVPACTPAVSTNNTLDELTTQADTGDEILNVSVGEPFTVGVMETAVVVDTLWVTFDSVPEDTRCPEEVECEWSGLARVLIAVGEAGETAGEVFEYNTNPGDPMMQVTFDRYQLALHSLDPYPQHPDKPIDPDTYEITLTVQIVTTNIGVDVLQPSEIERFITFLYYKDLPAAMAFYEEIMGLELAIDQGWCKIYQAAAGAYIGLVDESHGFHNSNPIKPVLITFAVSDTAAWYEHMKAHNVPILRELKHSPQLNINAFVCEDPEGYAVEIQTFLD